MTAPDSVTSRLAESPDGVPKPGWLIRSGLFRVVYSECFIRSTLFGGVYSEGSFGVFHLEGSVRRESFGVVYSEGSTRRGQFGVFGSDGFIWRSSFGILFTWIGVSGSEAVSFSSEGLVRRIATEGSNQRCYFGGYGSEGLIRRIKSVTLNWERLTWEESFRRLRIGGTFPNK